MPEGPETYRMAQNIKKSLLDKKIISFKFQHKSFEQLKKVNEIIIIDVFSFSKAIIIRLHNRLSIISHNQLYGKWTFHRPKTIVKTNRQLRIEFITKTKAVRLWSATDILVYKTNQEMHHPYLKNLGPDILDKNTDQQLIISKLKSKQAWNRQLSSVLLDQSVISGLGNYLRSEILFFAGLVHTKKPSDLDINQIIKLAIIMKNIAVRACKQKGKTIDLDYFKKEFGNVNNFNNIKHMVFGRKGFPCFKCGKKILKLIFASRRVYICPICQKFKQ